MINISKKVALVTGASAGMGKSIARDLLKKGVVVYATARRTEKMEDLKQAGARILALDVTSQSSIDQAIETINKESGGVDILINNAGYGSYGAVEDVAMEEAKRQFDVNLFGLAAVTKAVIPGMRAKKWGKIVNISSMGGKIYTPLGAWYHASKHALEGWSDCLRFELKPFGIDVIIIEPGGVQSEWADIASDQFMKVSGKGNYADLAIKNQKLFDDTYKTGRASAPEVVSSTVIKALTSKRPATRYRTGYMAKLAVFSRWLMPDKLFDTYLNLNLKMINR